MSIQRAFASSPPLTRWKYDVFLSFRGEDTRKGFTDHLYTALDRQGITTFRDDPELQKGQTISPALYAAIEDSRFALIVLSQNYASSTWCLDELVRILECMKERETVLPIFYEVVPSDVRWQKESFGKAFAKHEERFRDDIQKVQRWRSALSEVASFSGWNSNEWYESKLIRDIIKVLREKLPPTSYSFAENLVGIKARLQPLNSLLGVGEDDVRFIGIWGMGGIGKTTMVRAVYERISHEFEYSFLITDVRDSVEKGGLLTLQRQLLSGIWTRMADITDLHEGSIIIRRLLSHKKILLILDDVSSSSQLKYMAGKEEWFGSGSRVLITSRNEHLLIEHGVERRLKVEEFDDKDSLQLFSWKAFKRGYPEERFLELSRSVISYAKGLPLALEVLGSFLYGRDLNEWKSALRKLGRVCNLDIFGVLKLSYDELDPEEKKIFLDIACFFNGQDEDQVTEVLTSFDVSATIGIKVLMERSLLTHSYGILRMHDLIQEMGHQIVHQESPNEPGRCSRLWLLEDIRHVFTHNTGTEAIEGIYVDSTGTEVKVNLHQNSFSKMNKLRYLKINDGFLPKGLEYLPNSLRILDWTRYPLKFLPSHFNPQKLVELSLCHSCIKHVQIGNEPLYKLKTINLSHSLNLVRTPNFKGMPYLEFLFLEGCIKLYEVDPGIEVLERLAVLNLKDCKSLVRLPSSVGRLKSLKHLNLSGCSKLDKLPDEFGHVTCLEKLDVSGSGIREMPSFIGLLKNLKELSLAGCKAQPSKSWSMIPNPFQLLRKRSCVQAGLSLACLSGLHSLTDLNLSDCNLSEEAIPYDFGGLASLKSLDLSKNQFVRLPDSIGQLCRLKRLQLDQCPKLLSLPELPSDLLVNANNCSSLDTLGDQTGDSVLHGRFVNCFKMAETESYKSNALLLLARYLKFLRWIHSVDVKDDRKNQAFDFIAPGYEIPEWCHQSMGSSITVELHPGWFRNKWMGFACCVVFETLVPVLHGVEWSISYGINVNGKRLYGRSISFGDKWRGQPALDHIWFFYVHPSEDYKSFKHEWKDIYYKLLFFFKVKKFVKIKKCGVRVLYEEDIEELWQTMSKQKNVGINTKRGLQHYDDDQDDDVASSSTSQAHPKRIKLLHAAGPSGSH